MKIPGFFPKWDPRVDGLEPAGNWALECERSRLPAGILMPRTGQIWQTVRDCEVHFHAQIQFPPPKLTNGIGAMKGPAKFDAQELGPYMLQFGTAILREGEKVRISQLCDPKPIQIAFVPVRYQELHEAIIPAKVRALPTYRGEYELSAKIARTVSDLLNSGCTTFFNEDFHLIEDVP